MSSSWGGGDGGGRGQGYMGGLLEKLNDLDQLWKEQDCVINKINKIHRQILSCKLPRSQPHA